MEEEIDLTEEIDESGAEKRGWVGRAFVTLIVLAITAGLVYLPFWAKQDPLASVLESDAWWVPNVGEYHPLLLHLPIGIIFLAVAMEVFGWLSFGRFKPKTGLALFLAFLGGTLACVTGLFDLNEEGIVANDWSDDMFKHMWMGIVFVGVVGLAFLMKLWAKPDGGHGPVFAILLFGSAGVMGYGSHFGGLYTHSEDPIANTLKGLELIRDDMEVVEEEVEAIKRPEDRLAFAEVVIPIMDEKCLYCHSEAAGKDRGDLLMDSYANLLKGGASQWEDEFRTLVPGNAKESYMIEVMKLPMDDDMHMPPSKKEQMEAHEIAIIEWWVNTIPASETLDDKTLAEMGAPPEILEAVGKLVSPKERQRMEAAKKAAEEQAELERIKEREALQAALDELKQKDEFKTALKYVSKDSSDLDFTAVSLRSKLDDETLAQLKPVASSLASLDVSASSVSEGALAELLPQMPQLERLNLSQTEVSDQLLDVVAGLENLSYLNLYGTRVTDGGIMKLKVLTGLEKLYLWDSQVTEEGAKALKEELPGLYINLGSVEFR